MTLATTLLGQEISADAVPKRERDAMAFLDRQILVLAANRGPQIGLTSYRTVAPREEERSDGGVDSLVGLQFFGEESNDPLALTAEFITTLAVNVEKSKTWRLRRLDLIRAGGSKWFIERIEFGRRHRDAEGKRNYLVLPHATPAFDEANKLLVAREERNLVGFSIDMTAERPHVTARYLLTGKNVANQLIALRAELASSCEGPDSMFDDVEAIPQTAPHERGTVGSFRLRLRSP